VVKLREHKKETENKAIEKLAAPAKVYIPLSQHIGKPCEPLVKAGDYVHLGQKIAAAQANVYSPIHSSVSGKVAGIQDWPHPVLGRCRAIVIENDGLDKLPGSQACRPSEEINSLGPDKVRDAVLEAGIVGMGGASFPSHIKLNPPKPVDTLIVNGAECEPYLTGDYRLMVERTEEILKGIELIAKCLGVKNVIIGIEDNKPEAIEIFSRKSQVTGPMAMVCFPTGKAASYKIKVLKSQYPQGGEKQLILNVLGKEVPSGKLPFEIGVVVHNVSTVFAIYEAVYCGKPLYERVVTVAGSCVSNPGNFLARIGTPFKDLIDPRGLKEEPAKIIVGGPMMGIAQFDDKTPVIKSTTGILLYSKKEALLNEELACIRCGACVRECPAFLMPTLISLASKKGLWPQAKVYGASDCIECGICSYVCPSNIRLVQHIKRAKLEVAR